MRPFGRVDVVPGLGHVETQFFHIWFVPLLPVGSFFVRGGATPLPELSHVDDVAAERRVPIGFKLKSLLCAWLRAALHIGVVAHGAVSWYDGDALRGALTMLAGVAGSFIVASLLRRLSTRRRDALMREVGLTQADLDVAADVARFI